MPSISFWTGDGLVVFSIFEIDSVLRYVYVALTYKIYLNNSKSSTIRIDSRSNLRSMYSIKCTLNIRTKIWIKFSARIMLHSTECIKKTVTLMHNLFTGRYFYYASYQTVTCAYVCSVYASLR